MSILRRLWGRRQDGYVPGILAGMSGPPVVLPGPATFVPLADRVVVVVSWDDDEGSLILDWSESLDVYGAIEMLTDGLAHAVWMRDTDENDENDDETEDEECS